MALRRFNLEIGRLLCLFDIVLSTLVLDHANDWDQVFREFHRVLRHPGYLSFSVGHPFDEFMTHPSGNYLHTELVEFEFRGFGTPVGARGDERL